MIELDNCENLMVINAPDSKYTEEVKLIHDNLIQRNFENRLKVINIASTSKSKASSILSMNLGYLYSTLGKRVLLIDVNLNEPELHNLFGLSNNGGLTGMVISHLVPSSTFINICPNFDFLPSGNRFTFIKEFVESPTYNKIIEALKTIYDVILIDSVQLGVNKDSFAVANTCDGCLLCIDLKRYQEEELINIKNNLTENKVNVIGVVSVDHNIIVKKKAKTKNKKYHR